MNREPESRQQTIALPCDAHRGIDRYSVALITGATSFDDLLHEFRKIAQSRTGMTFLTLDDLDQCLYTSGHARERYGLGADVVYPDNDSVEARESYEAAVFAASQVKLNAAEAMVEWDGLFGTLATVEADVDALVKLNRNPGLLLDDVHVVQNVPADGYASLLAEIPNGYFSGDWTPFQNLAVTRRLVERHGYVPMGIGARTLGFVSTVDHPGQRDISALIADLQHLYGHSGSSAWQELAQILGASSTLVIGYSEDFAELVTDE